MEAYNDFADIANTAIYCETIVANKAILIKWTLENVIWLNKYKQNSKTMSRNIIEIVIMACDSMLYFSSKTLVFPSVFSIAFFSKRVYPYSTKIKRLTNNWEIRTTRFLNIGINMSPINAEVISLAENINMYFDPVISLAFYRSVNSFFPIGIILCMHNIYFPLILKTPRYDMLINDYWKLVMIGFQENVSLGTTRESFYEFRYSTDKSGLGIVRESIDSLDIGNSTDGYLPSHVRMLPKEIEIVYTDPDTVTIKAKKDVVINYSKYTMSYFRRKLKSDINKMSKAT